MKDILIYDGECGICSALAVWAQKNSDGNIEIFPYQNFDFDTIPARNTSIHDTEPIPQ